jgi:hypothetical protein
MIETRRKVMYMIGEPDAGGLRIEPDTAGIDLPPSSGVATPLHIFII